MATSRHDQLDPPVDPLGGLSRDDDPAHHQYPVGGGTSEPAAATHRHHFPAAGQHPRLGRPLQASAGDERGRAR